MAVNAAQSCELQPLPAGLGLLYQLARALAYAGYDNQLPQRLRVIATVPTLRLAGPLAALGAVHADLDCTGCWHAQLEAGQPSTGWVSGVMTDANLARLGANDMTFDGLTLRGNRDVVHRLPPGFPERPRSHLEPERRTEIASALSCSYAIAGQRLSARCAHPVIITGEPSAFIEDVDLLTDADPGWYIRGWLHPGRHLRDWFRHPVLAVGHLSEPEAGDWAAELHPRLVILAGSTGWVGSSRQRWPAVPQLILLPRRQPPACTAAAEIAAAGWPAPVALPPHLTALLRPAHGIELAAAVEPQTANGEDEW